MASPFYHPPLGHVPGVPQVADAQLPAFCAMKEDSHRG